MANIQNITRLAEDSAMDVAANPWAWTNFLLTASRLYRYPYPDQLLIHAQRPDATACASFELWKDTMHRYIKKGSKGIALIDDTGDAPKIKYVFDVSDTGESPRLNSRSPNLWELSARHVQDVREMLESSYETTAVTLPDQLFQVADRLAADFYADNEAELLEAIDGSMYEGLTNIFELEFTETLAVSIAYTLMNRCGLQVEEYIDAADFPHISNFDTPQLIAALGTANSDLTEQVLMSIGSTVKAVDRDFILRQERNDEHGENHLPGERRLSVAQPDAGSSAGAGRADGQIRPDAEKPPEKPQANAVQRPSIIGQLAEFSAGNRPDRPPADRADGSRPGAERPAPGQRPRPASVATAHEQPAPPSGGIDTARPHIQQLALFPSEQDTIKEIAEAHASAISISSEDIDTMLLKSSGEVNFKFAVYDYMKDHGRERGAADFLKAELPIRMVQHNFADGFCGATYDVRGLRVYKGSRYTPDAEVLLPWPKVQARIVKLIAGDKYLDAAERVEYEAWKAAQDAPAQATPPEQAPQPEPEAPAQPPRMYEVGDVVYNADDYRFVITDIVGERVTVELAPGQATSENGMAIPTKRSVSRAGFEDFLFENPKNKHFSEYLAPPFESPTVPEPGRMYDVGDMVYLDKKPYVITNIADNGTVRLLDYETRHPRLPVHISVDRGNFHNRLMWDERNQPYLDFYSTGPDFADPDALDVLRGILKNEEWQAGITQLVREGADNGAIAQYLHDTIPSDAASIELDSLYTADYFTMPNGVEIEILDKSGTKFGYSWHDAAPIYRWLAENEWQHEPPQREAAPPPMEPEQAYDGMMQMLDEAEQGLDELRQTILAEDEAPAAEKPVIPTGTELEIDGRRFVVERVDYDFDTVSLQDITFQGSTGFPIFRTEPISFVLQYWKPLAGQRQAQEPEAAAPVRVAPAFSALNEETEKYPPAPADTAVNFRITDDALGTGGAKTKFKANIAAIQTLKAIEAEKRYATPEEQQVLSGYVGWGGIPQAFDKENGKWQAEYAELKELLSPEEYRAARASTKNAHYTTPVVIRAMYDAIAEMGFKDGNILEPACGSGNFLGMLPDAMQGSKLYGVELDSITGRIARQLYPKADISVTGFEKTNFPNAFFDVAVGNVPFGGYKVADKDYNKLNYNIHDYFFAKTFDKVRPGGIVAFVTSKGTMDKKSPEVRKYLAQRGELLGAVRLPNNAFQANAGTEVTCDILFFKKRDRQIDIEPGWVHLGQTADGVPVNSYFAENPHMVLGRMEYDESMYGRDTDTSCIPIEGAELSEQLATALSHIHGEIEDVSLDNLTEMEQERDSIPADPDVKNHSFTLVDGEVYFRENSRMYKRHLPKTTTERVTHMIALRESVNKLLALQVENYPDAAIYAEQKHLNSLYDTFTKKYGLINSRGNNLAFSDDSAYYLLCSLEILDDNGELERKADMFHKRTIKKREPVTHVDTADEALAVSIAEKACVDLNYMHSLSGIPHEKLVGDLAGAIFRIPAPDADATELVDAEWVTADEYLSGDVRRKLHEAEACAELHPGLFAGNVEALKSAQIPDLDASEISVRLGAEWVEPEYIQQFMDELLEPGEDADIQVSYFNPTGDWNVSNQGADSENVNANVTYGTQRASAYRLLEDCLNQRDTRIYDTITEDGKKKTVLNKKETMLAQQKQEVIKEAFKDWVFQDAERRQYLVHKYNVQFNSVRPREYDGSHITFSGMNPDIDLRPHQLDAIAHQLYGDNVLLAHEVGAGKTFEMVAAAMESKRLGLTQKSMFAVPNHLTEQTAAEFLRLYPSANILVAREKDFETANRKKFCARIATGDYDAVIVGHSQFEKIPISRERQERLLNEQIEEIVEGIEEMKRDEGEHFTVKRMEKLRASMEAKLEKLTDAKRKDDVVTFEQLGVDRLFVDEAHNYKNLHLITKMRNVAGLSTSDAQKSNDLFLKCQYLDELTGGKGIVFATGTPVSNSMTELYTMMRYLQHDTLVDMGFKHFDSWAAQYGETTTAIELAPEGTGYRARTRFAKFYNLPELMNVFKECADIKTADMLNLPTPKVHFHNENTQPSDIQLDMIQSLSERATAIHNGGVNPATDNMLKITGDGRKIGLDQRLIDPLLPDNPDSKVNTCINNVFRIWDETKAQRSTQLIFCDMSTPKGDGTFNVYDDIRKKLVAQGVPEKEIAFIHEAKTKVQKRALFAKVRRGQVRVLLGSTPMMGSGTNVQDKLIAMHDLDCPWRPSDLAQRAGRIVRQGNENKEVHIYRYVTEKTFDAYLYQTLETKQRFIAQIMTSKTPLRSCEDLDATALSFAEIKALCAGNPLIKEKTDLDLQVRKLRILKSNYQSQHYRLEDNLTKHYPAAIRGATFRIKGHKEDMARIAENTKPNDKGFSPMKVLGVTHTDKEKAGNALLDARFKLNSKKPTMDVGSYRGMDMRMTLETSFFSDNKYRLTLSGAMPYTIDLGGDVFGNLTRINNALDGIQELIKANESEIVNIQKQTENAKAELQRPFPQEDELAAKVARLSEVDSLLNLDEHTPELVDDEPDEPDEPGEREEPAAGHETYAAKGPRPSIIGQLRNPAASFPPQTPKGKSAEISL